MTSSVDIFSAVKSESGEAGSLFRGETDRKTPQTALQRERQNRTGARLAVQQGEGDFFHTPVWTEATLKETSGVLLVTLARVGSGLPDHYTIPWLLCEPNFEGSTLKSTPVDSLLKQQLMKETDVKERVRVTSQVRGWRLTEAPYSAALVPCFIGPSVYFGTLTLSQSHPWGKRSNFF